MGDKTKASGKRTGSKNKGILGKVNDKGTEKKPAGKK